ncbi:hypothetical protein [Nonomuraea jabiensis]|uniref:hypothetical protein n=1 Tax=Nonomuraea jabiensis TaxID=882448 RepID=UPI003D71E86C
MLLRLAYLTVTNAFAVLRMLPMSDRDKDVEILALRHQITVLERQLGAGTGVRAAWVNRDLVENRTVIPAPTRREANFMVVPRAISALVACPYASARS